MKGKRDRTMSILITLLWSFFALFNAAVIRRVILELQAGVPPLDGNSVTWLQYVGSMLIYAFLAGRVTYEHSTVHKRHARIRSAMERQGLIPRVNVPGADHADHPESGR